MKEVPLDLYNEGITPQGKRVKIPLEWRFGARGKGRLIVKQLDLERSFLSFETQISERMCHGDFFFDGKGGSADFLTRDDFESSSFTNIHIQKADINALFTLSKHERGSDYWSVGAYLSTPYVIDGNFGSDDIAQIKFVGNPKESDENILEAIWLENFGRDRTGKLVDSPRGRLIRSKGDQDKIIWVPWLGDPFKPIEKERANMLILQKENGDTFELDWEVDDEGQLVVTETELQTKKALILHVPLVLDTTGFGQVAAIKPPYEKTVMKVRGSRGKIIDLKNLEVPWRRFNEITGINFGYIHPPIDQQEVEAQATE